jgi:drug/metabolite transporter (DMT)-like permease
METWISFTLLAVVMQSLRTAGQKQLAGKLTAQATTLVRYLFGLPFALVYFLWLRQATGTPDLALTQTFYVSGVLAGLAQIIATVCLVRVLTLQNFAVGTALVKTEAILTAAIGSVFFAATLSTLGWLAVIVGVIGAFVASNWKVTWRDLIDNKSLAYGLAAGLGFALASLWIREASLSLALPRTLSAAAVLLYLVALQSVFCLAWIAIFESPQLGLIRVNLKASWFIGLTSVLGSIGWFTAMSLQNPAIVKTLGQSEFVVTLLITSLYFGESVSRRELLGIGLVALSIVLLLNS